MRKSIRTYLPDYLYLLFMAGSIIALDIVTKEMVRQNIPLGGSWMPLEWLSPYARVVNWFNTGAAFGLFKEGSQIFMVLAVVVMALIIFYFPRIARDEWFYKVALAMQFAGAAGNFIDRIRFDGKVTDFISVGSFAVFNVADASITIGCVLLLIASWINDRKLKNKENEINLSGNYSPEIKHTDPNE